MWRSSATAGTLTIGYINALSWFDTEAEAREFGREYIKLLRAKYPDWAFGREELDANMHAVEVNLDKPPYNLRMRLTEGRRGWQDDVAHIHDADVAAGYQRGGGLETTCRSTQQMAAQQEDRKVLLEQADTRGL